MDTYDQLLKRAGETLKRLFPSYRHSKNPSLIFSFLIDILGQVGVEGCAVFHRMNPENQKKAIEGKLEEVEKILDQPPADLIAFYGSKLGVTNAI